MIGKPRRLEERHRAERMMTACSKPKRATGTHDDYGTAGGYQQSKAEVAPNTGITIKIDATAAFNTTQVASNLSISP